MSPEMRASVPGSRVMIISQVPPPVHGSSVITQILVDELHAAGFSVDLTDRRFSSSVGDVGRFSLTKVWSAIGLLRRAFMSSKRADICIFFVTNRTFSFLVDSILSAVLRRSRVPTIAYVHTNGYRALSERGRGWRRLVYGLFGCASAVVCLGDAMRADVEPFVRSGATLRIIGNTTPEVYDRSAGAPRGVQFLYLSNFIPEKGVSDFLRVAAEVTTALPSARFIAAGAPVSSEQLAELRATATQNTSICGRVEGAEKAELIGTTDVLVFPSRYQFEAQPVTILEAMSVGIPVIAYDVGGIAELVEDNANGIVITEGDDLGLREAVVRLGSDADLRARLSEGAIATYNERFSRDLFRARWIHTIGEVIG